MEPIFFPAVAGYPILITFDTTSLAFYLTVEFWLRWNSIAQSRQVTYWSAYWLVSLGHGRELQGQGSWITSFCVFLALRAVVN